ncbi:helix-turn-helix domain-containing protein [Flavonifractor plautii]|uniref:helix-turn-helix domain-containing protein n=1 Tax=Flavonifractor plautii TaxID=292800 RepID=UPI00195AA960|nr:helix-turn-helix transcriptional regulator [Flavonifractor plautii]MBM6664395.1 helix-turn-helix transcriptional regulator [Flavonifractor plautii]
MSLMVEKLAYVKKLRHLTSEDISRLSGVPLGTLNKILSGQTKNPAIGPMDRITRVLRVPIRYLLDDELPPECCVTANSQDGVVLLSPEELRLLLALRRLEPQRRRTAGIMLALMSAACVKSIGTVSVKRTFCYTTGATGAPPVRAILIPEVDAAAREADFAVLLNDGSMEPVYPSGAVLLCAQRPPTVQEYGVYLYNQEVLLRRLCRRRGVTRLLAPSLAYPDLQVTEEDHLDCLGAITGQARGCRWEQTP